MTTPYNDPSSSLQSITPESAAPGPWWKKLFSSRRRVLVISVAGAIVVIVGIGVVMWYAKRGGTGDDSFGSLPFSDNRDEQFKEEAKPTKSGLSGKTCEHPDRRAIGVMLAGDPINRPVSGFASADMVWELPVLVSNVTRLLAVYQCSEPADIGSVRSARHDYLFLADGIDAIVGHWGGSYHALNRIAAGEFQTINALTNPFGAYFRKHHLPAPYNGFTTYERLWNALQKLGYRTTTTFKGYDFKDDDPVSTRPGSGKLTVAWPGPFKVHYEYNQETNRYQRFWAGVRQVDGEDNTTPVSPSSVVIMRATNGPAQGPGGYNDVGIEGEGKIEVYQDGKMISGTWRKNPRDPKDPVHFLNDQGEPIRFVRGQVWIMTPDNSIPVTWEAR